MTRITLLPIVFVIALQPCFSSAATAEFPLALSTWSNPYEMVSADFELGIPVAEITDVTLRLGGEFRDQHYMCGLPYYTNTASARIELLFGDDVDGDPDYSLQYSFPQSDDWQSFTLEQVLVSGDASDWPCLADGIGQIGLAVAARDVGYVMGYPCNPLVVPITLSSATLVVTYDPGVPTTQSTWGTLKAMYHR